MRVKILQNSVKFYLPRLEGYSETVRTIADEYGNMSLIEFDGYFEGKLEPVKYTRVEVHTAIVKIWKKFCACSKVEFLWT